MRTLFVVLTIAALAACGGGGGSSAPNAAGGVTAIATPLPTAPPTAAPVFVNAGFVPTTAALGASAGTTASITLPASTSGSGAVVAQLLATQPATAPVLQSATRLPRAIGTAQLQPLLFITLTPTATISFGTTPAFTFALGAGLTIVPPAQAYVAYYDPANAAAGWQNLIGPATPGSNPLAAPTLTFASNAKALTFQANQTYVFVLFTTAAAIAVPTPAPAAAGNATPGPAFAYMAPGPLSGSFQSAISTGSNYGEVINISRAFVIDNNGTNPNLAQGSVAVKAGTSVTTFARSVSREVPGQNRLAVQPAAIPPLLLDRFDDTTRQNDIARRTGAANHTANRAALGYRRAQQLGTTAGSTTSFAVSTAAIGQPGNAFVFIPATLAAVSAHGYIWVDNTLALTSASIATIGSDFDAAYASDVAHFGTPEYTNSAPEAQAVTTPCDGSGNPIPGASPIPILIPPPNGMHVVFVIDTNNLGTGLGGYFSSLNHLTQGAANCDQGQPPSNEASMIYVGYNTSNTTQFELQEDLVRGTAHEFQHLINFVNHVVLSPAPAAEDRWINEGLSVLAQDLAIPTEFPLISHDVDAALINADDFMASPSKFSLTGFTGIEPGTTSFQFNCVGCYGQAYLFQRYLYDRFGGDAYTHAMETSNLVSLANLQNATRIAPAQAISDFAVALITSGRSVVFDPRYTFVNFNPYGTYVDQFGRSVSFTGPGIFLTSPGTIATLAPYIGTFYYVEVPVAPATGAGVTVTDLNGTFALTSGLLQF
jgi:hypothetical protein